MKYRASAPIIVILIIGDLTGSSITFNDQQEMTTELFHKSTSPFAHDEKCNVKTKDRASEINPTKLWPQ